MKNIKKVVLGISFLAAGKSIGQTEISAYGTFIPSQNITIATSTQPTVERNSSGHFVIEFADIVGQSPDNTVPTSTSNHLVSGGPLFYNSGPGGATLTCGSSGICAELSNTTYIQYVYEW